MELYINIMEGVKNLYTDSDGSLYHNPFLSGEISKEYYNEHILDFVSITGSGKDMAVTFTDTPLKRLHMVGNLFNGRYFSRFFGSSHFLLFLV